MSKLKEKTIYFVRHGESVDNPQPVFQSKHSPLSEKGKEQADKIADRAKNLNFEVIISSPLPRAKETALAISRETGKEIKYSEDLVEVVRPDSIDGAPHTDEEATKINKQAFDSLFGKGEKVLDAENFDDLMLRVDRVLNYLLALPESRVLVAAHGLLIKSIVAKVVLGEHITPESFGNMNKTMSVKNTGITVLKYKSTLSDPVERWRLIVYNDHNHLV